MRRSINSLLILRPAAEPSYQGVKPAFTASRIVLDTEGNPGTLVLVVVSLRRFRRLARSDGYALGAHAAHVHAARAVEWAQAEVRLRLAFVLSLGVIPTPQQLRALGVEDIERTAHWYFTTYRELPPVPELRLCFRFVEKNPT